LATRTPELAVGKRRIKDGCAEGPARDAGYGKELLAEGPKLPFWDEPDRYPAGSISQARGLVGRAGQNAAAVRAEGGAGDVALVAQRGEAPAALAVPEPRGIVGGAGQDTAAVPVELGAVDNVLVL